MSARRWSPMVGITYRSTSQFAGPNLLLPGGGPVVFHTARSRKADGPNGRTCREQAIAYEEQWIAAEPDELRPLRLSCPGHLYRHLDGYDCTAGERCPGSAADHETGTYCNSGRAQLVDGGLVDLHPRPSRVCSAKGCRGVSR